MNTRAERKLYLLPEEGMIKGVCAGLARYFDVPVKLVRFIAVLSIFFRSVSDYGHRLYRSQFRTGTRAAGGIHDDT
ncbi:hypothetical protein OS31_38550 [Dickeya oryzae]